MKSTDASGLYYSFLEQLGRKRTRNGTLWMLANYIVSDLGFENCFVHEYLSDEGSLRLLAKNGSKEDQMVIIKNPSIIHLDEKTVGDLNQGRAVLSMLEKTYTYYSPILHKKKYFGVLHVNFSAKEVNELRMLDALCRCTAMYISNIELAQELEAMEQKIELLANKNNEELDVAIDTLSYQFAELKLYKDKTDLLLSEVYHRVSNNLQMIISIINLYNMQERENSKNLVEIGNRVRILSAVHSNIIHALQANRLNLGNFIRDLMSQISYYLNGLRYELKNDTLTQGLHIDAAVPLGLFLFEITSYLQSMHSGSPLSIEIAIEESVSPDHITCSISSSVLAPISPDMFEDTGNINLMLLDSLITQLEGEFMETSSKNQNIYLKIRI